MVTPMGLLLVVCAAGAAAGEPWPVPNGDFQQVEGGGPAVWRSGSHDGGDYTFSVAAEGENRFLRISGAAPAGRAFWSLSLPPCPPPRAFRVRFRFRTTTARADGFVRLRDGQDAAVELSKHDWVAEPEGEGWTTFERDFAVPATARQAPAIRAEIILYSRGKGETMYDDVSLETLQRIEPRWPDTFEPLAMPFRPHDKMTCQQNPPDFSWPQAPGADGYHLQVARERDFARVVHQAGDLAANFHNFPAAIEAGVWYWRVRFRVDQEWSAWTEPRRFRVDPDAWRFAVPPVADLLARVPATHPRIWATRESLAEFRARAAGPRKEWFATLEERVRRDLANPPAPEPTFAFGVSDTKTAEWIAAHNRLRSAGEGAAERVRRTAFVYLVTGDEALGRAATAQMLNLAAWNPEGASGYRTHDQVHRAITWKTAVAYDWCCNLLTPEERQRVLEMVRTRSLTMLRHLAQSRPLAANPYESHGWTAFGYLGVVAIATLQDIPDAEGWFRQIVPTYVNLLPPWGDEDGGWCQGTAYWQYSQQSNKVFMDALLAATGLSLYDKAFSRNSGLFPLYTLPHGSPRGHFGDGNDHKPSLYHVQHYRRLAQLYRDPVLQWAWQAIGDLPDGGLEHYFSGDETLPARPPSGLPPSRWFRDIDWVSMHSDLADPERVSLHFKSSPIGSFNHSHADQNSFVLNAFGEALAIDSGYYDWYNSPHDRSYTRQTLAHNAVTHAGGLGQPIHDPTAKGRIAGFATHARLDACTGDATTAYHGGLTRALRHVIYLRPATFVVVDDLAAAEGKPVPFEWWLHALKQVDPDADQMGATVAQGEARLRVRFHSPGALTVRQRTEFVGPPSAYPAGETPAPVRPQGRGDRWPDEVHTWFATPPLAVTKIVATLQAHRAGDAPAAVASETANGVLRLSFATGERVLIQTADAGPVESDGLRFDGAAAALAGDAVLLVQGTRLSRGGQLVLAASAPVTAAYGGGELALSCADDTTVTLRVPGIRRVRDGRGRDLPAEMWSAGAEEVVFRLEPGFHALRLE